MMKNTYPLEACMAEAIQAIEAYVERTTGQSPTQAEMAAALGKYFVLKEIKEFIEMARQE